MLIENTIININNITFVDVEDNAFPRERGCYIKSSYKIHIHFNGGEDKTFSFDEMDDRDKMFKCLKDAIGGR